MHPGLVTLLSYLTNIIQKRKFFVIIDSILQNTLLTNYPLLNLHLQVIPCRNKTGIHENNLSS